jgi:hypothetical protein
VVQKSYRLYAALHEDIAEGFVWLKIDGIPARCVVEIVNPTNNKSIFCEALQLEDNFLRRYKRDTGAKIGEEDLDSLLVVSYWYRERLGDRASPLKTYRTSHADYPLRIWIPDRWYSRLFGKLRACQQHPQVVVRVSIYLGLLSVSLGLIPLLSPGAVKVAQFARSMATTRMLIPPSPVTTLTIDGVFEWRKKYGDLLAKSREAAAARLGPPKRDDHNTVFWDKSPATGERSLVLHFDSDAKDSLSTKIQVGAQPDERLDVTEVLKRAELFTFDTGTLRDSTTNYFSASTKDGRNILLFEETESGTKFAFLVLMN